MAQTSVATAMGLVVYILFVFYIYEVFICQKLELDMLACSDIHVSAS